MPVSRFRRGSLPNENLRLLHADFADAVSIFGSVEVLTYRDTSYEDKNEYYRSYIIGIFNKWKLSSIKTWQPLEKCQKAIFFFILWELSFTIGTVNFTLLLLAYLSELRNAFKEKFNSKLNYAPDASLKSEELRHIFYSQLFQKNIDMLPTR